LKEKEIEIIKQAIINEIEGYEFYQMAAEQSNSEEGKEAFKELAGEELKHVEYLRELFNNIQDEDNDIFNLAFIPNPPSPKIFNWDNVTMKSSGVAVSIFGIGIGMEKASIEFYENARESSLSQGTKKLFDILIKWEKVHLDQFTKQYKIHKEDWWQEQSFAPF